jgi:copper chaperone
MALKFQVSTLENQQAAQDLRQLILTSEPQADVDVDVQARTVTIDSQASEETFKELIVAAGHEIADVQPLG